MTKPPAPPAWPYWITSGLEKFPDLDHNTFLELKDLIEHMLFEDTPTLLATIIIRLERLERTQP